MLVSELVEEIKIQSGQVEIDFEEISIAQYAKILERRVAPVVAKHIPYKKTQRITISASPYIFNSEIPDWISQVIPIDLINVSGILAEAGLHPIIADATNKSTFLWDYNSPNLYVEYTGTFNIISCHSLTVTEQSPDDYEIEFMDDKALPYVIDLMSGYAMQAMGRSRRTAKLTELPFELDTSELVQEGIQLVTDTLEKLKSMSQWYLAV